MNAPRTYWHLVPLNRRPSDYEIVSSRLMFAPGPGSEVRVGMRDWYQKNQQGSPLHAPDWDAFRDPRETTYATYVALKSKQETFVDGVLDLIETRGVDRQLSLRWLEVLSQTFSPMRYPVHGLQMVAAYLGRLAPAGRIAIACAFQVGDEIRRVNRLAYRLRLLELAHPELGSGLGGDARNIWETFPVWQPWRKVIEQLLVTWDWGEAFAALNLVVKPAFDRLFLHHFAAIATRNGDDLLSPIFASLEEDAIWQRSWSTALARMTCDAGNGTEVLGTWVRRWWPQTKGAIRAFGPMFDAPGGPSVDAIADEIERGLDKMWSDAGIASVTS